MRATPARLLLKESQRARGNELANHGPVDQEMARQILNYFVRNPQAADTLEGVARWRLMDEVIWRRLDETEAALDWLVAQGYLTTSISPGGTATFRLNPAHADDISQFVAGSSKRPFGAGP
jgi:hypothetical protein